MSNQGNLLQEFKMRLSSDPLPNCKMYGQRRAEPQLAWRVKDNQPHMVVYTNVENDKNNGIIEAGLDSFQFGILMQLIRDVAEGRSGGAQIQNRGHFYTSQGRSEQPGVLNVTNVGINDNGVICIALIAKNRPEITFQFGPREWHPMMDVNGNSLGVKEQSRLFALGYVNIIEKSVVRVLGDEFISHEAIKARREANRNARGGGNRGGYNGGGNGGGYNNNSYKNNNNNNGGGYNNNNNGNDNQKDDDLPW